jgi:hypothetical protein
MKSIVLIIATLFAGTTFAQNANSNGLQQQLFEE